MDFYLIIGLIFVTVFLVTFGLLYFLGVRNRRVRKRLAGLGEAEVRGEDSLSRKIASAGATALGQDAEDISDTRFWLARAGYYEPHAVFDYYWLRLICCILLAAVGFVAGTMLILKPILVIATAVVGALLGIYLPTMWVVHRVRRRTDEIRRAVPNLLDLLVVCVEAGLSLTAALQRLAAETQLSSKAVSEELQIVTREMLIGRPKGEVFRRLASRTGVEEFSSLAVTIIQADKLGTSIAQALRTLADTVRFKRRQRAEEQANKASVKLVFPLVFLIFPELLVVLIGPAIVDFIRIMKDFAP